jgi:hypothetical protein
MSEPRGLQTMILGLLLAAVATVAGCVLAWTFSGSVPWLRYVAWVLSVPTAFVGLLLFLVLFERRLYGLIGAIKYLLGPKHDFIRKARPEDAEEIAQLEAQSGLPAPGGRGSRIAGDLAERTAWWRDFLSIEPTMNYYDGRTQVAYVAAYGVGVKAYIAIQFHPVKVEIVGCYCDPEWYPKENHKLLILHAYDHMRNCSRYQLQATVSPGDPVRRVYEKMGAKPTPGNPSLLDWGEIESRWKLKR